MPLILPRRNLLSYPAGIAPGFDPSHLAARTISSGNGLSAVSLGANYLQLLRGSPCSETVAETAVFDGCIGVASINSGTSANVQSLNNSVDGNSRQTAAAIVVPTGSGTDVLFANGSVGSTGIAIYLGSLQLITYAQLTVSSGIFLNVGEPYFVAVSGADNGFGDATNFVVKSLRTGQVFTAVGGRSNFLTSDGTYLIGSDIFGNKATNTKIAAVAFAPNLFLSIPELQAWAADPWAFWYPRQTQMLVSTDAAAATQYAAFSIPQRGGRVITQMRGY